jgi:cobalt-zinc-cadmium efflux system outer membrane protein
MFAGEFATYLTAVRESEAYRVEILPRAEEAYRLYLARYREMAAAYPQVLVAQRRLLELSSEYLQRVEAGWQSAVRLQGLLAGDGLGQAGRGEGGEDMSRAIGRGGQQ